LIHGGLILLHSSSAVSAGPSSSSFDNAISYIYKRLMRSGTDLGTSLDLKHFISFEDLGQTFSPDNIISSKWILPWDMFSSGLFDLPLHEDLVAKGNEANLPLNVSSNPKTLFKKGKKQEISLSLSLSDNKDPISFLLKLLHANRLTYIGLLDEKNTISGSNSRLLFDNLSYDSLRVKFKTNSLESSILYRYSFVFESGTLNRKFLFHL